MELLARRAFQIREYQENRAKHVEGSVEDPVDRGSTPLASTIFIMEFEDILWLFNGGSRTRGICRLNIEEAGLLYRAAAHYTQGRVLEIGRRYGGSTLLLCAAVGPEREVVSLDLKDGVPPEVSAALAAFKVRLLIGDSTEFQEDIGQFDLLFIDGDHTYEGVKADTLNHWDRLRSGGLVAFHDDKLKYMPHCQVYQWTAEWVGQGKMTPLESASSLHIYRKT